MGIAPSVLVVVPQNRTIVGGKPGANIMDNKPLMNVMPFGTCLSLANPLTAGLTAAALGVLTPGPCIPVTPAPWAPGSPTVLIGGQPALNISSKCMCAYGGAISITFGGVVNVTIP